VNVTRKTHTDEAAKSAGYLSAMMRRFLSPLLDAVSQMPNLFVSQDGWVIDLDDDNYVQQQRWISTYSGSIPLGAQLSKQKKGDRKFDE